MNICLNEYSGFCFELNFELNHFLARFNEKMNFQNVSPTPTHIGCGYGCIFVHIGVELELTIRLASEKLGWRQNSHSAEVNSSQNVTSRHRNRVEMHKPNYL